MTGLKETVLVVGGSSGLGLRIADRFRFTHGHDVIVTGRTHPSISEPKFGFANDILFRKLELAPDLYEDLTEGIDELLDTLPHIDHLVYAAGFYQEASIDELDSDDVRSMGMVGLLAPTLLVSSILKEQKELKGFIAITSSSQWTPRERESLYAATKAGLAMLAESVSLDARVGKVLVAAPAGMQSRFYRESQREIKDFLEVDWVADQVMDLYKSKFNYKMARILRGPPRVEVKSDS